MRKGRARSVALTSTRGLSFSFAFAFAFAFASLAPTNARAQSDEDKNIARSLAQEGQSALAAKDFKTAEDRFKRSVRIFDDAKAPVPPTLLLGYARGAAGNGHLIAAQEAYTRIIRTGVPPGAPQVFASAVDDAKKEVDAVAARVAKVKINVNGCADPRVTLDDAPMSSAVIGVSRPVDPGTHVVKATAEGCKPGEASFTVGEGKETEANVVLEKAAQPPNGNGNVTPPNGNGNVTPPNGNGNVTPPTNPPPSSGGGNGVKIAGFAALGVGGAGLILGAITGGIALGKASSLKDACPTTNASGANLCPSNQSSAISSYKTMTALSTTGFIIGGVGIAAGVVLLLVAPKNKEATSAWIRPYVGAGEIGAVGAF